VCCCNSTHVGKYEFKFTAVEERGGVELGAGVFAYGTNPIS